MAGVVVGENGALQIASGEIAAHSPEHYATRRVACQIDRAAACPIWRQFLADALPDGAASTLQEWFGAALVRGKVRELSKGLIVYGPSRTGKTQITEVVRALLGARVGATILARRIAANPSGVLRMTKRLMREGERATLESLLELSAAYQAIAHHTADHHEAVRAFVEKRSPKFS